MLHPHLAGTALTDRGTVIKESVTRAERRARNRSERKLTWGSPKG